MKNPALRLYFRHGMLPQLIAFEACVRNGSVTRAADELHLAQPTVSCLIKKLSNTMGAPLTRRLDRNIGPTELGQEVLGLCRDLMKSIEQFEEKRCRHAQLSAPPR